ncbi:hypothetical protein [Mycolicibacterium mengxianglii]|uniref:hypothetical protein n=1 Tax=Mycolicibacterium mengxianglii TaxID=2736649 RepID=UPI0018D0C5CC|nr:hypothetical protein [Mycolicibacterium mengxianglii]
MGDHAGGLVHAAKKLTVLGIGTFAAATAFLTVSSATASADVKIIKPRPVVTSRQAQIIDSNALRRTAAGQARGWDETRSAGDGVINAQGEVRDGVIAVPGTTSSPFNLRRDGSFHVSPPVGSW